MRIDTAACKYGIIKWKIGFAPGAMAAGVIAFNSTTRTSAESTTNSLIVFLVRHVAAAASKTREVNAGATAGEGKSADHRNHSLGEPICEVCTDQRCSKCSPGVSDTLGVPVRPVGFYVGDMVLLQL